MDTNKLGGHYRSARILSYLSQRRRERGLLKEDRCRVGACVPYAMLFLTPFFIVCKKIACSFYSMP